MQTEQLTRDLESEAKKAREISATIVSMVDAATRLATTWLKNNRAMVIAERELMELHLEKLQVHFAAIIWWENQNKSLLPNEGGWTATPAGLTQSDSNLGAASAVDEVKVHHSLARQLPNAAPDGSRTLRTFITQEQAAPSGVGTAR
jgi:hypothetical protein